MSGWLWPWLILVAIVATAITLRRMMTEAIVYPWEAALLYRDGRFVRALPPGRHRFLDPGHRTRVARLATGEQHVRLGQMDVVSADQFAFRLHLALDYTVTDVRAAYEAQVVLGVGEPVGLHDRVAAAALAAVGARALDAVIGDLPGTADAIAAQLDGALPHLAIVTLRLVKIDLPPETRRMLTEAERARREGLATLERARSEQASLRTLANAARLVKDNPELAQLRLLRTIEEAKGPTTIVIGDPRAVPTGG